METVFFGIDILASVTFLDKGYFKKNNSLTNAIFKPKSIYSNKSYAIILLLLHCRPFFPYIVTTDKRSHSQLQNMCFPKWISIKFPIVYLPLFFDDFL